MSEHGSETSKRGLWATLTRARKPPEPEALPAPASPPGATPLFKTLFGTAPEVTVDAAPALTLAGPGAPTPVQNERPARVANAVPATTPIDAIRQPIPPQRVAPAHYLAPLDLEMTATAPIRVLAMGSCFLQSQLHAQAKVTESFNIEFMLINQVREFPAAPPSPIADYDCQLIQVPLRFIMRDELFLRLDYADIAGYQAAFDESCSLLRLQLDQRMRWNIESGLTTFVLNFMVPQFPGMGRFFPRFDLRNIEYFVLRLNQELELLVEKYRSTYILDVDRIAASFGRRHMQDDNYTIFGHNGVVGPGLTIPPRMEPVGMFGDHYDLTPASAFSRAILAELRAMHRTLSQVDSVKLVVVDLDDTLWNGVSGDSADVGPHMVEGWPVGLIEALHYLRKRGVLLAIISKNNEARIREIWRTIFPHRLRLEDFCATRINWRPKPENMAEILSAVNLLPRNVVFIDDNPAERAQMEAAYPGMRTLGSNPYHFRRILLLAPEAQPVAVTTESARRTTMVQAQIQRDSDRASLSIEQFTSQQNVTLRLARIADVQDPRFPRVLELINKTNQFNTTGRRWTLPEVDGFLAAAGTMVSYEVEDRYTAYGLVGVVLLHASTIVQWVMSCRIIGLGVEHAVMHELVSQMRRSGKAPISASLTVTSANQPCHDFFRAAGFAQQGDNWVLDAATAPRRADHVTIVA